jgi:hypothetical protein
MFGHERAGEQAGPADCPHIEDMVADGHADPGRRITTRRGEDPEWDVVKAEVGFWRHGDEARHHFGRFKIFWLAKGGRGEAEYVSAATGAAAAVAGHNQSINQSLQNC